MLNFTLGTLALSSSMLMITLTETRKGKILVSKLCARMPSERWRAGKTRHSYLTMKNEKKRPVSFSQNGDWEENLQFLIP